ncbi:uncharacterized protein [Nicotiana sylvestris]|uniref:uncharacterized protein n=1 Tax=Nicotiana sylvestris TaxID=4096 RepID=UPI00388CA21A
MHKIILDEGVKPSVEHQKRLNEAMQEVVKKEIIKWLDAGVVYPISDNLWTSLVQCVPKKGGMTVVTDVKNELIPEELSLGRECAWTTGSSTKSLGKIISRFHFLIKCLIGWPDVLFIASLMDTPVTIKSLLLLRTKRRPLSLVPMVLLHSSGCHLVCVMHNDCLNNLDRVLARCEETNLVLNWEKYHFMVEEGIVLSHKISKHGIEVDKAKIEVISKCPPPAFVKGVRSFLGHASFYRRFIKDFSKVVNPLCKLLEKDAKFHFNEDCMKAFELLKFKLTTTHIITAPD